MDDNQYTDLAEKIELEGRFKTEDLEEQLDYFMQEVVSKTEEFTGLQTGFFELDTKLDGIQQELKKDDQPKGTGVAIADVITSGLKYYADHITKSKKEESNE